MSEYYKRDGSPYKNQVDWAEDFEKQDRKVDKTILKNGKVVSTVYLGSDHRFGEGKPLIFETMVFPSEEDFQDLYCERYSTEEEAKAGHKRIVNLFTKVGKNGGRN